MSGRRRHPCTYDPSADGMTTDSPAADGQSESALVKVKARCQWRFGVTKSHNGSNCNTRHFKTPVSTYLVGIVCKFVHFQSFTNFRIKQIGHFCFINLNASLSVAFCMSLEHR